MIDIEKKIKDHLPFGMKKLFYPFYKAMKRIFRNGNADDSYSLNIGKFDDFEIAYRKGTADEEVIKHSFSNDIFFSKLPDYNPKDDHVIIDIGAHIGTFSILASSKVKNGKVYAIEASQDSANYLKINTALNHCANISIHHLAFSDNDGTCALYYDKANWGHSIVKQFSKYSETVESMTLSTFIRINKITRCDLMKLNCEGAEFPILLSATNEILQYINLILIFYHCDLFSSRTETDLISHLERSNFKCSIHRQNEQRGWIVAKKNR